MTFFLILKNNPNLQTKFFFFFLGGGGGVGRLVFIFSQHTHKLHGDILLQFNGNSMCSS